MNRDRHPPHELAKNLKLHQYFTLSFGCIIGVGWVVLLGKWLELAGPLGVILGFAGGGIMVMAVGLCYAEVSTLLPASGGEIVFAYEVRGTKSSFALGWFLALSFIVTISFLAISAGWLINTLVPQSKGPILYSFLGESVTSGSLIIGIAGMLLFTAFNYRGLKSAAILQDVVTYTFLIISIIFIVIGFANGKRSNLEPLFAHAGASSIFKGIFSVFVLVPFMLSGFEVIPQVMEEKDSDLSLRKVGKVMLVAIGAAVMFYVLIALSASLAYPWQKIITMELPASGAFEAAVRSPVMGKMVLLAGLLGIITTWNTCFIIATRIIFALSRARIISPVFSKIHPIFKSPFISILFMGGLPLIGVFLGKGAILPVANVGGATVAMAFGTTCLVFIILRKKHPHKYRPYRTPGGLLTGYIGMISSIFILFLALYQPYQDSQGSFPLEWAIFLIWAFLGVLFWFFAKRFRNQINEQDRYKLILGHDKTKNATED